MSVKTYTGEAIDVTFEMKRCIHAAECANGLKAVFDVEKRPWVQPDQATADDVQATVDRCPSGALKYRRKDGVAETVPTANVILVTDNGEYQIRGDVTLSSMGGEVIAEEYRMTLCRCGASANKPFCDNSHKEAEFSAAGEVVDNSAETADLTPTGKLAIVTAPNGPLLLQGNFEIHDAQGTSIFRGEKAALCRCGGSTNKPFCDGTHSKIDFVAE